MPSDEAQVMVVDEQAFRGAPSDAVGLGLRLLVSRGGGPWRRVPLDTPVCSGDAVRFEFEPKSTGPLTVFNDAPDGSLHQLYPHVGASGSVVAGTVVRLPETGTYWVVGAPGAEILRFYVGAAPETVAAATATPETDNARPPALAALTFRSLDVRSLAFVPETTWLVAAGPLAVTTALDHGVACGRLP